MSKLAHTKILPAVVMGSVLLGAAGCPSADPEAKYDAFLKETKEERDEALGMKMDVSGSLADISGTHLFALAAVISPATPLQFVATVDLQTTPTGGTMNIEFQPLGLEVLSTTEPRNFVGEVLVLPETQVDAGGGFAIDLGEVSVVGEANPITGAEIIATLALEGAIQSTDLWCGTVSGDVSSPIELDLAGSTFAAVRLEATDPASLPTEVLSMCPEGGGSESMGSDTDGDTDTDSATGG